MRLINLKTLVVKEFIESDCPPYVILSHSWGADEVSLQMLRTGGVEALAGYEKIKSFCRQGAANGFEWGWVDTCCIDKTSSAELSEAINSGTLISATRQGQSNPCPSHLSEKFC